DTFHLSVCIISVVGTDRLTDIDYLYKKSHSNTLIVRYRNGLLNKDDFGFIWTQFPSPFSIFLQIPNNLVICFLLHG
ncbi:hypothetical protein, partial [Phocaeicola faecicola]|uniref:hypothetical protein n=1 Tax=Phocaeicola faecicola TaxID=2739389 RepID=UPI002A807340